jgi:hypothetical protein
MVLGALLVTLGGWLAAGRAQAAPLRQSSGDPLVLAFY